MSFATFYVYISEASKHLIVDKLNPKHELLSMDRYFINEVEVYPTTLNGNKAFCSTASIKSLTAYAIKHNLKYELGLIKPF